MAVTVQLMRLAHGRGLALPAYETAGSAGMDLRCACPGDASVVLQPGRWQLAGTGIALALPTGFEAQIRPRSGLAARHGVTLLNTPGTIDSDYRGEIKVILINHGPDSFTIARGDRIAQMIIAPVVRVQLDECDSLDETGRGAGGFGSSGVR